MSQLKIAMISYHTCPLATLGGKDTGGMNVYVREVTRHLGQKGVHVDVFTRSQDEHVPHVLHDLGYGNRVVHVPAGPEIPLPKKELVTYLPEFVEGIEKFAENKGMQYDLIHSHYWMSGIAAEQLKAEWRVPIVHMFHTLGMMKNRVAQSSSEIEGEYRIDGEKKVMAAVDRIVSATPAELSQLQFLYHAKTDNVVVIPPGVDVCRFYPIPPDEAKEFIGVPPCDRMILFVGRIEPLKGLEVLFEAIALMKNESLWVEKPFCLAVIGGEPEAGPEAMTAEMARLQALRHQYGLQEMVTFLGKRSQETLPYYYSAAEVVVVPSFYESFGMVALEAMACATPVVASEVGGLAFLVQDGITGYTVPANDPRMLADRLSTLIRDPAKRERMGQQAFAYAQDYSWGRIVEQLMKVYEDVLNPK